MADTVTEGSSASYTVAFFDAAGVAATPQSIRYRIDCATTGAEITAWTAISAASSITLPLTPTENQMQAESNTRETRRVTVEITHGASDKLVDSQDYTLTNSMGL